MLYYLKHGFNFLFPVDGFCEFNHGVGLIQIGLEQIDDFSLNGQNIPGRFFSSLNARLLICVDVHQVGIESNGPFKQTDQEADG